MRASLASLKMNMTKHAGHSDATFGMARLRAPVVQKLAKGLVKGAAVWNAKQP